MGNETAKPQCVLDLVEAGKNLYDFIHRVNKHCTLYMKPVIKNAIQRYEQKWLPLVANHLDKVLVAPLDIEWVWYVHMLNPKVYEQDCITQAKTLIDHKLVPEKDREQFLFATKQLWNKSYPGEVFHVDLLDSSPAVDNDFISKLKCDLFEAVCNEMIFNYQVALPHYKDEKFLQEAVKRYQTLLDFHKTSNCPVVPYFDNAFIWHAHMAFPRRYKKETEQFFGFVLDHEFSISVRYPESEYWALTPEARTIWTKKGKSIAVSGSMFRGHPSLPHNERNPDRYSSYSHKAYYLQPKDLHLQNLPEGVYRIVIKCEAKDPDVTQTFIVHDSGLQPMKDNWSKAFDMKNDESRFVLKTDRFYGLSISVYKQLSSSAYEIYLCTSDFPPSSEIGKKVNEFALPLSFKFSGFVNKNKNPGSIKSCPEFTGCLILSCPVIQAGSYMLQVEVKNATYKPCSDLHEVLQLPKIVVPYHSNDQQLACSYDDFRVLGSLGDPAFQLRIVHCLKPKVSVVEINDFNSELVASAHTIDHGTLPFPDQIADHSNCCTLNTSSQRAMVIRSENFDWAILRASWQGYLKFVDSGHLVAELFILNIEKPHWVAIRNSGPLKNIFTIDLGHLGMGKVIIDVKLAQVSFSGTVSLVPELLCLSACISILFTLCQTRHAPQVDKEGNFLPYSIKTKKSYKLDVNSLAYVINAGLYCPSLPRSYEK